MVETEEDPQNQTNQDIVENEEEDPNQGELEAWIWILAGIALAGFSILTFIYVHPEAPPEGAGETSEIVRIVIRIALFLCGCILARNGFKLLKK